MSDLPPDEVQRRALKRWREREATFPAFCRRMNPDALDMATGAWQRIVDEVLTEAIFQCEHDWETATDTSLKL